MCIRVLLKFFQHWSQILLSGGAAYVLDSSTDLTDIIINDGSHLVVATDQTVSNVLGDGRSMVHVGGNSTLHIQEEITSHGHVYNGSGMLLGAQPEVTIVGTITVHGHIMLAGGALNQSLLLSTPGKIIIDSLETTHLSMYALEVGTDCAFTIVNQMSNTFHLAVVEYKVYGDFSAETLLITDIELFEVGTAATVAFDPESSGMYLGPDIDIRGDVALGKHVSIVHPCQQFLLEGGTLTWPTTTDIITIECDIVNINGQFSPGTVSFGVGVGHYTVGGSGVFTFTADGPILVDTAAISGKMYVDNLAIFKSNSTTDSRISTFVINYPSGTLELNRNNMPAQENGTALNDSCSTLHISSLTIDKTFTADSISIGNGITDITVNRYGTWTFTPCGVFHVDTFYTNGTVTSTTPLDLEGIGVHKLRELHIEYGGTVTLDSLVQSSKAWTGVSTIGVHDVKLYGKLHAGLLQNHVAGYEGWDRLDIYVNGTFYFEASGPFVLDYFYTNGRMYTYGPVNMTSLDTGLIVHFDTKGYTKFDSLVSSNWVEESAVNATTVQMDSGSYWSTGNTRWTVTTAEIAGQLYSHPYPDVQIVYFTISGSVDFSRQTTVKGFDLSVGSGATFDMAYQHTPDVATEGCEETKLLYKTVTIAGTARAGSLFIGPLGNGVQFCTDIVISGTLDVTGGGYLYDQGPGKLQSLFSFTFFQCQ